MDLDHHNLFQHNKFIEERLEYLIHTVESRIDKLLRSRGIQDIEYAFDGSIQTSRRGHGFKRTPRDPYSGQTFLTFRYPYIRDFRNFSAPLNEDSKQIEKLPTGVDVDKLWKLKVWSRESKQQLREAVWDTCAKNHLCKLLQQKNQLIKSSVTDDTDQKVRLIDEQAEQVRARDEPRIFVPENRNDAQIDWCAISAKLTSSYHHDAQDCRLMWSNQLHWAINSNDWTKDEDICLINAVAKHGKNDWDLIAHELNTGRVAWQCCARYHQHFACIQSSFHPQSDETEKIIEVINLCRIGNFVPWNQVMYFIRFHSLHQVKHQWQRHLSQQQGKGSPRFWSVDEDLLLLQAVERLGEKDWTRVADCVPGRTNKSCRERYIMRARFQTRTVGSWRPSEDTKLLLLVEKIGPVWSELATYFPERNHHQIRNRYELLKTARAPLKKGPIRHRKLYRSLTTQSVDYARGIKRHKPASELEVDKRLNEILSTYLSLNKTIAPKKNLTCRSSQDERIYQSLVETLCDFFICISRKPTASIDFIMIKVVETFLFTYSDSDESEQGPRSCMIAPSRPTLQAYRVWALQQDYLRQYGDDNDVKMEDIDERFTAIVVGLFFLPALLSKIRAPSINPSDFQLGSVVDAKSKNLYKIRHLQSTLLKW